MYSLITSKEEGLFFKKIPLAQKIPPIDPKEFLWIALPRNTLKSENRRLYQIPLFNAEAQADHSGDH